MISGFFYDGVVRNGRECKGIKKIAMLLISSSVLYFAANIVLTLLQGQGLSFVHSVFTLDSLFNFLFYNASPIEGHLWYLGAILYVLLIMKASEKILPKKAWYIISLVLFVIDIAVGKYTYILYFKSTHPIFLTNYLFVGIVYFSLGMFVWDNKDKICKFFSNIWVNLIAIAVCICLNYLEYNLVEYIGFNPASKNYTTTNWLMICVFIFFLNNFKNGGKITNCLAKAGREYATIIYVMHIIIRGVIHIVAIKLNMEYLYEMLHPFIIFAASLIFAMCYKWFVKKLRVLHS